MHKQVQEGQSTSRRVPPKETIMEKSIKDSPEGRVAPLPEAPEAWHFRASRGKGDLKSPSIARVTHAHANNMVIPAHKYELAHTIAT
eukprot:3294911-Amphidinium_carterae.2